MLLYGKDMSACEVVLTTIDFDDFRLHTLILIVTYYSVTI